MKFQQVKKLGTLSNNYLMVSQESSNLQNSDWFVLFQLTKEYIKNWVLVNYTKSAKSVERISQTLLGLPEIEYHQ
jgi:hypothetical protein